MIWIYSPSRILPPLLTSMMERSALDNEKASTPFVPSRYMHETCQSIFNIFIGSNQSFAWGIISLTTQTNPIVQTCPEPARLQIVVSDNRPDSCRGSMPCNVVHRLRWLEGWNSSEEIIAKASRALNPTSRKFSRPPMNPKSSSDR